jgi:hypothetical protein
MFLRHVARTLPLKGFVWAIEFGERRKSRCHVLLLLDGNDVRADEIIAMRLGEHWRNEITVGLGGYWNCNGNKPYYEARGINALGMVTYADSQKRGHLDVTAMYLVKRDALVRLNIPGLGRTFGRGVMPTKAAFRTGRPRKLQINAAYDGSYA